MFVNIYINMLLMCMQQLTHVCIKPSSFVKTISAGIFFFFFRLHNSGWSSTPELFLCVCWLWKWGSKSLGKYINFSSHRSLLCSAAAPSSSSLTPGFSVWHIFSHWSFWSSVFNALWFQAQAISFSSVDNFNRAVVTQVNYLKSCKSSLSLRQKPRKTVMILAFNLLICASWK